MFQSGLRRSLAVGIGALLIASCSDPSLTAPKQAVAVPADWSTPFTGFTGFATKTTGVDLKALWWNQRHQDVIKVSKTIDASGGTISIPETGLTVSFPAGAVANPITVTITSDESYVAYKMEPAGTKFLKDVTATQLLNTTSIFGRPLQSQLYAAYIADDNISLSGTVQAQEIEPSTTIFSPVAPYLPQAQVWIIRHFSRYMLASG